MRTKPGRSAGNSELRQGMKEGKDLSSDMDTEGEIEVLQKELQSMTRGALHFSRGQGSDCSQKGNLCQKDQTA